MQHVGGLEQALQALKDIHLPVPQAWWQLPMGAWLLIGLALLIMFLCILTWPSLSRSLQRRRRKKALCQLMQQQMQHIQHNYTVSKDAVQLVAELSVLLRRVGMTVFEQEHVEGLIQEAWLEFLDSQWHDERPAQCFTDANMADLLNSGAYRSSLSDEMLSHVNDLISLCQNWLDMVGKRYV